MASKNKTIYCVAYIKLGDWDSPEDKIMPILEENTEIKTFDDEEDAIGYATMWSYETELKVIVFKSIDLT